MKRVYLTTNAYYENKSSSLKRKCTQLWLYDTINTTIISHTFTPRILRTTELPMMSNGMLKAETRLLFSVKLVLDADGVPTFPLGLDLEELSTTLPRWMDFIKLLKTWQRIIFARTVDISQQISGMN